MNLLFCNLKIPADLLISIVHTIVLSNQCRKAIILKSSVCLHTSPRSCGSLVILAHHPRNQVQEETSDCQTEDMYLVFFPLVVLAFHLLSPTDSRIDSNHVSYLKPSYGPVPKYNSGKEVETKSLDELYADALREGGRVILYAGGDTPGQQDYFKMLFENRFPGVKLDVIVDYSKFHNGRIENQLANKNLIPDIIQLQTIQDFPRWKKRGLLLKYKPRGWKSIYEGFKDPDGFYTGIYVIVFTNCANRHLLRSMDQVPRDAYNYLNPDLRNKITITYPNDDDAVLFYFKLIVDRYGWRYIEQLLQQNPIWVRGTQEPMDAIGANRTVVSPAVACPLVNSLDQPHYLALPRYDPFVTWPQTAAIFRNARRPAAAKLYLNWITDAFTQQYYWPYWSVRRDVPPPAGYGTVFDYPSQTDPLAFGRWMSDREQVELFRSQITLYIGEVQGKPSPGILGIYPEKALAH
ncbi:unnamed protein product [Allacma fusca]|uniref:Uncharacterized protein n=1 Tax=Allacma fusca TaxID=39272 RepID=A0A8J2Q0V2_9HEXA|nr:unnamed protein product [Allacma fusca]